MSRPSHRPTSALILPLLLAAACSTNEIASQPSARLGSIEMTNNVLDTNISVDTSRKLSGEATEEVLFGFIQLTSPVRCATGVLYTEGGDGGGSGLSARAQRIRSAAAYNAVHGKADILVAAQWSVIQEDNLFITRYTARVSGYPGTIRSITDNNALSHLPVGATTAYDRQNPPIRSRWIASTPQADAGQGTTSPGAVIGANDADASAAAAGDVVRYHYSCSLENGQVIFDSHGKGDARSRVAGSMDTPSGLGRALIGVKPGDHRRVVLPPADGFGTAGAPQLGIPPNATVVLDLQIDEVLKR